MMPNFLDFLIAPVVWAVYILGWLAIIALVLLLTSWCLNIWFQHARMTVIWMEFAAWRRRKREAQARNKDKTDA